MAQGCGCFAGVIVDMRELRELRVEVTTACNMHCGYCYVRHLRGKTSSTLTVSAFATCLKEALPLGLDTVSLTGGEPLLRFGLTLRLIRMATNEGLTVGLLTSGDGLTTEAADSLVEAGLSWARISLDADPHDHSVEARPMRLSERALRALVNLRSRGVQVLLRPTATPQNTGKLLPLIKLAAQNGVARVEIQPYMPCNAASVDQLYWMSPSVHFSALRHVQQLRQAMRGHLDVSLYPGWFEFLSVDYRGESVQKSRCGRSFLFLDAEGRVSTCGMSLRHLLRLGEGKRSLADVWYEDPYLLALREQEPSGLCSDCEWFVVCSETWCPAVNTVFGLPVSSPTPVCLKVMLAAGNRAGEALEREVQSYEEGTSGNGLSEHAADRRCSPELHRLQS